MVNLAGNIGEIRLTVEVKSVETGEAREVALVGFVNEEQLKQLQADGLLQQTKPE